MKEQKSKKRIVIIVGIVVTILIIPDMPENVSEVEMFGKRRIKYPFFYFIFYMKRYTMNSRSEKFRYIMQFAVYAGGGQLWMF